MHVFSSQQCFSLQANGCAGPAKCLKKSSARKGCPRPRSGPRAGRCRGASCRAAPRLCSVPSALSNRAPSGAQPMALPGCTRCDIAFGTGTSTCHCEMPSRGLGPYSNQSASNLCQVCYRLLGSHLLSGSMAVINPVSRMPTDMATLRRAQRGIFPRDIL